MKARYSTPATVSLGRLFLPFLFPDLASFERSADLIAHLRSLDASYRAACTEAQLTLLPPPMAITVYFIATSLPDRLASVRDALLLKHPSELTIEVLESALKDVESNLRSVAAASGTVSPPLFHGCTVPQLPTFTASLATAATDATAAAVTTASRSRGRGGKKGGSGGGGGGGSGGSGGAVATGGGGSAASGETPRAAAGDSTAPAGGGDPRARQSPPVLPAPLGGAATWYQAQRQQHLQQQQQPLSSQQPQQQQHDALQAWERGEEEGGQEGEEGEGDGEEEEAEEVVGEKGEGVGKRVRYGGGRGWAGRVVELRGVWVDGQGRVFNASHLFWPGGCGRRRALSETRYVGDGGVVHWGRGTSSTCLTSSGRVQQEMGIHASPHSLPPPRSSPPNVAGRWGSIPRTGSQGEPRHLASLAYPLLSPPLSSALLRSPPLSSALLRTPRPPPSPTLPPPRASHPSLPPPRPLSTARLSSLPLLLSPLLRSPPFPQLFLYLMHHLPLFFRLAPFIP
ncbi:unnamed protein product [Closterium sp. NIES-54]